MSEELHRQEPRVSDPDPVHDGENAPVSRSARIDDERSRAVITAWSERPWGTPWAGRDDVIADAATFQEVTVWTQRDDAAGSRDAHSRWLGPRQRGVGTSGHGGLRDARPRGRVPGGDCTAPKPRPRREDGGGVGGAPGVGPSSLRTRPPTRGRYADDARGNRRRDGLVGARGRGRHPEDQPGLVEGKPAPANGHG